MKRAITLASALAVATAALVAAAPAASAATACNTTTGGPFDGTTICYSTDAAEWRQVPYSVGSVCVSSVCTEPVSGYLNVPSVDRHWTAAWGTICAPVYKDRVCVPFTTGSLNDLIQK